MRSTLILSLSGLAAASSHFASSVRGHQKNLLPLGPFADIPLTSFAAATCPGSQITCDDSCAEAGATCCDNGDGSYCPDGYYCYDQGCCEDGDVCSGPPSGCTEGAEMCGEYCVPEGGDCCDTLSGEYCPSGQTCNGDGTCSLGDGSNDGDDDSSECDSDQESCGSSGCMPKGAECCGGIGYYCNAGDTCEGDGTCSSGNSSNSDDDDSDSDDSDVTSSPTYSLTPIPTSAGDDDNGDDDSSSDSSSDDNSSDDSNDNSDDSDGSGGSRGRGGRGGGDGDSAAAVFTPKFIVGLIAILPALL